MKLNCCKRLYIWISDLKNRYSKKKNNTDIGEILYLNDSDVLIHDDNENTDNDYVLIEN